MKGAAFCKGALFKFTDSRCDSRFASRIFSKVYNRAVVNPYCLRDKKPSRSSSSLLVLLLGIVLLCHSLSLPSRAVAPDSCAPPAGLQSQLQKRPPAEVHAKVGAWFETHKNFACAAQEYESAVRLSPALAMPHEKLAEVLEKAGKNQDAKTEWEAALKLAPESPIALHGMANRLIEEGSYPAAIELLQSAPKNEVLEIDLARAYSQAGSLLDAEKILRAAVAQNPASFILTRALVGILVDEHIAERTFNEPVQIAEAYAEKHPANLDAQRLYLQMLVLWIPQGAQAGDLTRARPLARKFLSAHPQDPYFLYVNGMLERQSGDLASAKIHLEKSVSLDGNDDRAHYELGMVLAAMNDQAAATREFRKSLDLGNTQPEVHFQLAKTLRSLGRAAEAEQELKLYSDRMASASAQRVALLKEGQAQKALAAGQSEEGIAFLREAIEATPGNSLLHFKLALALDKSGDLNAEKSELEKALQIDPKLALAENQLGYLASRAGDSASAEQHFRQAVQAAPAYAEAWVNLAATLGMESRIPEAQQAVAQALKVDPKNSAALQLQQDLKAAEH